MKKIHTRAKRKLKLSRNVGHKKRIKKKRPKTFRSEESARRYTEARGIKSYSIINTRFSGKDKKLKIVEK